MLRKTPRQEPTLDTARAALDAVIDQERDERAAELRRTLALAKAELSAVVAEESRRLADERRTLLEDRENRLTEELSRRLIAVQQRFEEKLGAWVADLERTRDDLASEAQRVAERHARVLAETDRRLSQEVEHLTSQVQDQKAVILKAREELDRATKSAADAAAVELDQLATEQRRLLIALEEQLHRREQELRQLVERESTEAAARIEAGFADVARRQVERFERSLSRESERVVELAASQFDTAIKAVRDDTIKRLQRELDRAVTQFTEEGERLFAYHADRLRSR